MANQSTPNVYPVLPDGLETRLSAIEIGATHNRKYFDDGACPYSEGLKRLLRRMTAPIGAPVQSKDRSFEGLGDEDKFDLILREIELTIEEMSDIEGSLSDAETSDRVQFVKAKTALIEKWVNVKEKLFSLKEISEFQSIIIRIMDDVLTLDQRQTFIDLLRTLRTTAKAAKVLEKASDAV